MELFEKLLSLPFQQKTSSLYEKIPFGHLFEIWADAAFQEFREEGPFLTEYFSLEAQEKIKEALIRNLSDTCAPTVAALMHLEKHRGNLKGESPRDRYLFFIEKRFSQLETFSYFPFLAETISKAIFYWKEQAKEFIDRLHADYNTLQYLFSPLSRLGKVSMLSSALSDFHNGHRTTYRMTFENGLSLAYKPKTLSLDVSVAKFLETLGEWGLQPTLKLYRVYSREGYGWCEWVPTLPCKTKEEVHRYYQRLGMWIGLVYLLGGTDCHSENLIASGEFPILVDLESLFHPITKEALMTAWEDSVFRTGFFPIYNTEEKFDFSPLTADQNQEISTPIARWKEVNTDCMEFEFSAVKRQIPVPRPKWRGKLTKAVDFLDDLLLGFEKMISILSRNKEKILPLIEELAKDPVRCILRSTELYAKILQRLTDPKLMHSKEERDHALDVLSRHCPFRNFPDVERIFQFEKEALQRGDIPFFQSLPRSTSLYLNQTVVASDCFENTALEKAQQRLTSLSEKELERQKEYIEQALLPFKTTKAPSSPPYRPLGKKGSLPKEELLLQSALKIGQKILELADPLTDGSLSWLSLEVEPNQLRHVFHPLSPHLYSGHLGIALFLAALGKVTAQPSFSEEAKKVVLRQMTDMNQDLNGFLLSNELGGMVGLGSAIYTYAFLGTLLEEKEWIHQASHLASNITKKKIEQDTSFDLLHGAAGLILALLSLHEKTREPFLLEKAKEAGFYLIHKAQEIDGGKAWISRQGEFLSSLSHGTAGIAYALLKLHGRTHEAAFFETAEKALSFTKTHPDCTRNQWCHGEAGVALAQGAIEQLYPQLKASYSLDAILSRFRGRNDHLCCGNFGRISMLWTLGSLQKNEELKKIALRETTPLLKKFQKTGEFRFFPPPIQKIQSPSFMRGLAGIGYTLIRMTSIGKELPEVLILE